MKIAINPQDYDYALWPGEFNNYPSMTVPDQSLTVKEVIERYTRGIPFEYGKTPLYMDDDDDSEVDTMPDLRGMDLTEVEDLKEAVAQEIAEHRKRYQEKILKARKKKEDEMIETEVNRRIGLMKLNKDKEAKEAGITE